MKYGVTIQGPLNVPSAMAPQASQLYSRNLVSFISTMLKEDRLKLDAEDELVKGTMVLREGKVVNDQVRAALGEETAE